MSEEKKIIAYKGFNKDWTCRDFQYEIGQTYEHQGRVEPCQSGFHSCEYPLDVFNYYAPSDSVFAVVSLGGEMKTHSGDTKIASAKITIETEIKLPELIKKAIEWVFERATPENSEHVTKDKKSASSTGDYGAASSTGKSSIAIASGLYGKAMASEGSAIVLCRHDDNGNTTHVRSAIAGHGEVKPLTWYTLDAEGNFKEITNED